MDNNEKAFESYTELKCSRYCWTEIPAGPYWMTGWSETSKAT
ncbi:hypothetical protein NXX35_24710 [Bacteroides xylanisolvens]|nr:hypothetical protein NXX35_24710 [Bacteroides xylanisolvens]